MPMGKVATPEEGVSVSKKITKKHEKEASIEEKETWGSKFLSYAKEAAWKMIPATLEGVDKAKKGLYKGLDAIQKAINSVVPATSELITGFVLPAHIGRIVDKAVEYGTRATTFTAKTLTKAGINFFTLGAPAWADAFRQHLAVSEGVKEMTKGESSKEVTALSYIDHIKNKDVQKALGEYYKAREELAGERGKQPLDLEKVDKLSARLAHFEINYKDNVDFTTLKSVLEKGSEFMAENQDLVDKLSSETAEKMIDRVEDYYKDQLGDVLGGKVEVTGTWLQMFKSPEKKRELLKEEITKRLNAVFEGQLNDEDTQKKMGEVYSEVIASFGVYRKYLKSAVYTLLRLAPVPTFTEGEEFSLMGEVHNGVKSGMEHSLGETMVGSAEFGVAHGEIVKAADAYIGDIGGFTKELNPLEVTGEVVETLGIEDADPETIAEITGVIKAHFEILEAPQLGADGLTFYPTVDEYMESLEHGSKVAIRELAESTTESIGETIGEIKNWFSGMYDYSKATVESKIEEFVNSMKESIKEELKESLVAPVEGVANEVIDAGLGSVGIPEVIQPAVRGALKVAGESAVKEKAAIAGWQVFKALLRTIH